MSCWVWLACDEGVWVVRGEEFRGRSCGDENTLPFISDEWVWLGGGGVRREGGWGGQQDNFSRRTLVRRMLCSHGNPHHGNQHPPDLREAALVVFLCL